MMTKLIDSMRRLVKDEQFRAMLHFGPRYNSAHEGYGVLMEELYEAELEAKALERVKELLLFDLHHNNVQGIINTLHHAQEHACLAACEYVQVAAVARKMMYSMAVAMGEPYYHTCDKCGANLDPGERCDCDKDEKEVTEEDGREEKD